MELELSQDNVMSTDLGERESSSDTYPAPYGRACSNCSQSKCKCIYPKAGGRCQRCQRLNKDCRQPPFHKRQTVRKPTGTKAARLEEKLEDLVSLLRAGVQNNNSVSTVLSQLGAVANDSNDVSPPDSLDTMGGILQTDTNPNDTMTPNTSPPSNGTNGTNGTSSGTGSTVASFASSHEPSPLQAEEYLTLFQTQMLPYFPCVYIPTNTTAEQLRRDKPFTWLCIMSATSRVASQRGPLSDKIKSVVAQRMVHDPALTDIDILIGILIYLSWSNQQVYSKANVHVFTQLATAAVYELGIHNPNAKPKHMALCVHSEHGDCEAPPMVGQTMEERRAVLACFLVTSNIATFLQTTDSLRWTAYMDDCLRMLEEKPECLNDEILVQLVRMQLILEKLHLGPWETSLFPAPQDPISAPPAFYLRPMEAQLRALQPRIAPHSQGYNILLLHHHQTAVNLYESFLAQSPMVAGNLSIQKREHLYSALQASKSWFEVFFSIPPAEYIGFPFAIFSQMVHNLVTLYQLSTLEDPNWDISTVRQTADVLTMLDNVVHNMGQVRDLVGFEGEPDSDVFTRIAGMYQGVHKGWEARLGPAPFAGSENLPAPLPAHPLNPLETMPMNFPLVSDNDWLSDMLDSITQTSRI